MLEMQTCFACGAELPLSAFGVNRARKNGRNTKCPKCVLAYATKRKEALGWSRKVKTSKLCSSLGSRILGKQGCGSHICDVALKEHYLRFAQYLDEYGVVKPGCESTYSAFITSIRRGYVESHGKEKPKKSRRDLLEHGVSLEKIFFDRVRHRIRKFAKRQGTGYLREFTVRDGRTIDAFFYEQFGYRVGELIEHFEAQFTGTMSWSKFAKGEIHIDHKSPMVIFGVEDANAIRHCFSLSNLQPLWADENSKKSNMCDLTGEKIFRNKT